MYKERKYSAAEKAGLRLLAHAIKRNVDRVEQRYRNGATRECCQAMAALCDAILENVEYDIMFWIGLHRQPSLPDFGETDEAYGEVE